MRPLGSRIKSLALKLFALLSIVRGYNLFLLTLAQYFAAVFIFSKRSYWATLFDLELFCLISATNALIAAGYIINNFYDSEKDWINRPHQTLLNQHISQRFKLNTYMLLNTLGLALAAVVSYRALAFFIFYSLCIWLYSHKLKKLTLVGNLTAAVLSALPFFPLFMYYSRFDRLIFTYAAFLFLLLLAREITKDFTSIQGDLVCDYPTLPVALGLSQSKRIAALVILLTALPAWLLASALPTGAMRYYFYFSLLVLAVDLILLYGARSQRHFHALYNLLRLLLVLGIFSIVLVKC